MFSRVSLYSMIIAACMINGIISASAAKVNTEQESFKAGQKVTVTFPGDKPQDGVITTTFKKALGEKATVNEAWKSNFSLAKYMLIIDPDGSFRNAPFNSALTNPDDIFFVQASGGNFVHKSWLKAVASESTK